MASKTYSVIQMNRQAMAQMQTEVKLEIVPGGVGRGVSPRSTLVSSGNLAP
jgi:hypothetical protein